MTTQSPTSSYDHYRSLIRSASRLAASASPSTFTPYSRYTTRTWSPKKTARTSSSPSPTRTNAHITHRHRHHRRTPKTSSSTVTATSNFLKQYYPTSASLDKRRTNNHASFINYAAANATTAKKTREKRDPYAVKFSFSKRNFAGVNNTTKTETKSKVKTSSYFTGQPSRHNSKTAPAASGRRTTINRNRNHHNNSLSSKTIKTRHNAQEQTSTTDNNNADATQKTSSVTSTTTTGTSKPTNENVVVVVRVRPLLNKEIKRKQLSIVEVSPPRTVKITRLADRSNPYLRSGKGARYSYNLDAAFGPEASQQEVWEATTSPLVDTVLEGTSATVFVYGATGA